MSDLFAKPADKPRELYFVVRGEVRGKGRPRFRSVGYRDKSTDEEKSFVSTYTDGKTRAYEARIGTAASIAKGKAGWSMTQPYLLRMDVIAHIRMPKSWSKKKHVDLDGKLSNSRIDADNILKAVIDACHNIIFADDKIVAVVTCSKFWVSDPAKECLQVRISTCDQTAN